MTTRTRYFVIASLLVLGVGIGSGLVAYYAGFPMSAFTSRGGPDELKYVPRDATVLAYADVRSVMTSEFRRKLREVAPMSDNGQREFQDQTGINIETDIDHVVAFVAPGAGASLPPGSGANGFPGGGMVLARGVFDAVKIEALMREHGAHIDDYKGKRLIVADVHKRVAFDVTPDVDPDATADRSEHTRARIERLHDVHVGQAMTSDGFALAFLEPGLAAVGSASLVRAAIDNATNGQNVTTNDEMMNLVRSLDSGNVWSVGRFDALQKQARLPAEVASRIPPITWFSVSSHVNGGINGVIRAETRDEESANNLRDVVRGFMALAKMQVGSNPEYQTMMQSLELGGTGKTVALSFAIPAEVFDIIGHKVGKLPEKPPGH
jgi:hypothetical protein